MSDERETPENAETPPHASTPDLEDLGEISLSDLGRAYARALGLVPDEAEEAPADFPESGPDDDSGACPVSPRSILEALLFVGVPDHDKPLTTRQIASMIRDVSPGEVSQWVRELNAQYEQEGTAYRIRQENTTLRMMLDSSCEPVRETLYGEIRKVRLSQQAIDVLAIVAYHQPTTREHVAELRGRDCGSVLSQLVRRELLNVETDSGNPRQKVYRTSDRFLRLFGLESIDDLPQSAEALLPDADFETGAAS